MDLTHALDLTAAPVGYHRFCDDDSINFQCNRWVQWIGRTGVEDLARAASGRSTYPGPSTYAEWVSMFLELAEAATADGRGLEAAYYERGAQFFMPPDDARRLPLRSRIVSTLQETFGVVPQSVPFEAGVLPCYDLAPEGEPVSTWVFFGGFDSFVEEWFPALAAVVACGIRVIAFDGPGQGGALEDHGVPMTPRWEGPLGAVLDHLGLADVTVVGASLGGGLAVRAAAREARVARVVAFDVLDDLLEAMLSQVSPRSASVLGPVLSGSPRLVVDTVIGMSARRRPVVEWGLWQAGLVLGARSPAEVFARAATYRTAEVSPQVRGDVLLLSGAQDHYVPAGQLNRQADALPGARSLTTRRFTAHEQAGSHCQVGNIGLAMTTILAWERSLAPWPTREP